MKLPKYPVQSTKDHHIYVFFSEGPQGRIEKNVIYTRIAENIFNLGFGDWNEELQDIDDSNRSNNGDRDKILATVAHTALEFTRYFPGANLFVRGSSLARTRLYQMSIASNIMAIREQFEVMGFWNDLWESFVSGTNYESFLVFKK